MHHPDYSSISRRFRRTLEWTDDAPLEFLEEGVDLYSLSYSSSNAHFLLGGTSYRCLSHEITFAGTPESSEPSDQTIGENIHFRYPLVVHHAPRHLRGQQNRVLILFHGLNERSFTKYVPWAYQIWQHTGIPVVLFPLTFHINRVLPAWGLTQQESYARRAAIPDNENAHHFNAVISDRIGTHPERFFWGAEQSYWDIVDLARTIRRGHHPHFAEGTRIDLLGFSAGGYIPLALLLEDPENLFSDSRGIIFASGASVRDVNLSSHLIVDHMAEIALMKLFVKYRERLASPRLRHWLDLHGEGTWFNAFCGLLPNRTRLEARLREIAPRLLGVANSNDQVMPPGAIMNALQGIRRDTGVRVEELNLGIHENPFASPDYNVRDRSLMTQFLDLERYGGEFRHFIELTAAHLSP